MQNKVPVFTSLFVGVVILGFLFEFMFFHNISSAFSYKYNNQEIYNDEDSNRNINVTELTSKLHPSIFNSLSSKKFSGCFCNVVEESTQSLIQQLETKTRVVPKENHFLRFTSRRQASKNSINKKLCPAESPLLQGPINVEIEIENRSGSSNGFERNWPMTFEEIAATYFNLRIGGYYQGPSYCTCRSYNAIIIPYRDRRTHLRYFLYYIHQLLQRQQLCYVIIVSEQDNKETFNKGQLMNTAFKYAQKIAPFDCYIFHDVDIIAEDDRILYACRSTVCSLLDLLLNIVLI